MSTETKIDTFHVDRLMADFIRSNAVFLHRATDSTTETRELPDQWYEWLTIALYAGASARLLACLAEYAPEAAGPVASRLFELMDGEGLSEWVGEEATRRGIDIEAVVRDAEEKRQAWLAKRADASPLQDGATA